MAPSLAVRPTLALLEHLDEVHGPSCSLWSRALHARAASARTHDEARELLLCARVCEFDALARPRAVREFDRLEVEQLADWVDAGVPASFAARVAELHWLALRDSAAAERAVAAHVRLALRASSAPAWIAIAAGSVARATEIALTQGRASRPALAVAETAAKLLERALRDDAVPLLQRCLEAHESLVTGDPERLAALAIECAERQVAAQRDHRARALYRSAARALARSPRAREAGVLATVRASVVAHVGRRCRARGDAPWIAASFLRMAWEELDAQRAAPEFCAHIERELAELRVEHADASIARAMQALAEELDFVAPSERVAFIGRLPFEPRTPASAASARPRWLDELFDSLNAGRGNDGDARDWVQAARACAASVLEVARISLASDPEAARNALARSIQDSGLVAPERAPLWQRGLLACIEGDALLGLTLVVPQLDHALREIDGAAVALTPVLERLDADTRRAVELTLYDREGWALRDQLGRGALEPHEYSQANANLVLWLALRLLASHRPVARIVQRSAAQ